MSDGGTLPNGWAWIAVADLAAPQKGAITDGPFGSNLKTAHYTNTGPPEPVNENETVGFGI